MDSKEERKKYYGKERVEEVQDIIDRMPTRFSFGVTAIIFLVFVLLLLFGFIVRYPDVVTGQIVINANTAPVRLVANSPGKLKLVIQGSGGQVREGEIIAYVQNSAELKDVLLGDSLLRSIDPKVPDLAKLMRGLHMNPSLGDLNPSYNRFANCANELNSFVRDRLFDEQLQSLKALLSEQKKAIAINTSRVETGRSNLSYAGKFYKRDSTLYAKKVISESELDRTEISYANSRDALQGATSTLNSTNQQVQQTQGRIKEIEIQKKEKEQELKLSFLSAYNELMAGIKTWEQRYVFRSPFNGTVQFLKFWTENQFVQNGEAVFAVVPKMKTAIGQVNIPTLGAGKITPGQEVIVKLDNFPYTEYGTIKGVVRAVGLSPNISRTEKGDIENYMVNVVFPNDLKTNFGTMLDVKLEARGTAEIITKDRRLIERFFDNLNYAVKK